MPLVNKYYVRIYRCISKQFPNLYCYCLKRKSLVKFLIAGTLSGSVDLLLLYIFHGLFNLGIVLATSLSFLLSFLVSFYLQKLWTFRNNEEKKMPRQLVLYLLNSFLSLNINAVGMHVMVNQVHVWYLLSQVIVNLSLGGLNFLIYKFIIFRNDDETNCQLEPTE